MTPQAHPSKNTALGVLACLAALTTLATNIILPAFPDIGRTLAVSPEPGRHAQRIFHPLRAGATGDWSGF